MAKNGKKKTDDKKDNTESSVKLFELTALKNIDSKESIALAREAIDEARSSNRIALEANVLAKASSKRASRANSIARAAIYIALATLIIQALLYIK